MNSNGEGFRVVLNPAPFRERNIERMVADARRLDPEIRFEVTAKPLKATRSQRQNRFLWGVIYAYLEQETGHAREDWHEFFLSKVYGTDTVVMFEGTPDEMIQERPIRRSSKLKVGEFAEYCERILEICSDYGITVPTIPEDLY